MGMVSMCMKHLGPPGDRRNAWREQFQEGLHFLNVHIALDQDLLSDTIRSISIAWHMLNKGKPIPLVRPATHDR